MSETPQENPNSEQRRYLHLKEINVVFNDARPNSKFSIEIEIAGEQTYQSPAFAKKEDIDWKCDRFVLSSATAKLTIRKSRLSDLKIMKEYASFDVDFGADNIGENNTVPLLKDTRFTANLIFGASLPLQDVADRLGEQATAALETKIALLSKIDKFLEFGEAIVEFADVATEANSTAKAVAASIVVVFKKCQKISKCHGDAVDLMGSMVSLLPLPKLVMDKVKEPETRKAMEDFLLQVKRAAEVLIEYSSSSNPKFYAKNWWKSEQGNVTNMKENLTSIKQEMTLLLEASIFRAVAAMQEDVRVIHETAVNTYEQQMLDRLDPVHEADYDPEHSCLDGTRTDILHDIHDWVISHQELQTKLFWLYGIAGSGKSSVGSSIASSLEGQGHLAGCFFFKRDIPERRSSQAILPTLAYSLSVVCKPYRTAVLEALKLDTGITKKVVKQQFRTLFSDPLSKCSQISLPKTLVIVVDALDECDNPGIASYLAQLAGLSPWLKVFITSRPHPAIHTALNPAISFMRKFDLYHANANNDILQYTRAQLLQLIGNEDSKFVEEKALALTEKASGLFIWISTVFLFLKGKLDMLAALQQILSLDPAQNPEAELDRLYTTVLTSLSQGDQDNIAIIQWILGAIFVTATNRPLPVTALEDFLSNLPNRKAIPHNVLSKTIAGLLSVLYEDKASSGSIRVCHPSFLDFIGDKKRSKEFWMDSKDIDSVMATRCLEIMQSKLKFNMCNLESSYIKNTDVGDLQDRISTCIPLSLQYSCLYWMNHHSRSNIDLKDQTVWRLVEEVLCKPRALFWLEALSLLGQLSTSIDMLTQASSCFQHCTEIASASQDLYRFVSAFYEPMEASTPHIYVSALSWAPTENYIAKCFYSYFSNQPLVASGKADHWKNIIRTGKTKSSVYCVAYSPDGRHIVSGSHDGTICIWDAWTGKAVGEPLTGHSGWVLSVAYSPDGRHIVSGSDDETICIWDTHTGNAVGEQLRGHSDSVWSVAYSPDGKHIVSGSHDSTICIWDAQTGKAVGEPLTGHSRGVHSVAYSPDGRRIVSGSFDKTICIWDAHTGKTVGESLTGHSDMVWSVAYSPDGRHVVSGSADKTICIWDAHTGKAVGESLTGHSDTVRSVAYSPDGRHIVSGSEDNTICIWDAHTGRAIKGTHTVHSGWVHTVAYSPDGRHIISGADDRAVCIWDTDFDSDDFKSNLRLPSEIPDDGWWKSSAGELLLWVPHEHRKSICCRCEMCFSTDLPRYPSKLDWQKLDQWGGTSWADIYKGNSDLKLEI